MFRQESHIYLGPLEVNPLSRIAPYLLFYCLMPDDFTRQVECAGA
jgi:hypothetical protein